MNTSATQEDQITFDAQQAHWQRTFASRPELFGAQPSYAARKAATLFQREYKRTLLELGADQGRDALFFARLGFDLTTLDYSEEGLEALCRTARDHGLSEPITTLCHDVRKPLPFSEDAFDACFSHMLYCMALASRAPNRMAHSLLFGDV